MAYKVITGSPPGVRLEKVKQPAEPNLPAYEDVSTANKSTTHRQGQPQSYPVHPELPNSHISLDKKTISTHWPLYSQDARFLEEMLQDQARYPPKFAVEIRGTHSETRSGSNGKSSSHTVTDFDFSIDMTHLLLPNSSTPQFLSVRGPSVVLPNEMAYRGYRGKTVSTDPEIGHDTYVRSYVDSPSAVRSFTLRRRVADHDGAALEALIKPLVDSTNYGGRLNVSFPTTHKRVTVYNACWQNRYRDKAWLRWVFYLSFLWIFAWPYLWFITKRWECVEAIFPYSRWLESGRFFVTKSEQEFFNEWSLTMRRAVLDKRRGWVDEEYKRATEEAAMNGGVVTSAARAWGW